MENDFIEDIEFKPITEGLGFKKDIDLKEFKSPSKKIVNNNIVQKNNLSEFYGNNSELNMGELSPFYSSTKEEQLIEVEIKTENYSLASKSKRALAFAIDTVLILSFYLITFLLSAKFLDLNFQIFKNLNFLMTTFPVLVFYFIFYFTFFDSTEYSTVGKRIFGMKIRPQLSLKRSFIRTILTLCSLICMGLPLYLGMHDALMDTEVIQ